MGFNSAFKGLSASISVFILKLGISWRCVFNFTAWPP